MDSPSLVELIRTRCHQDFDNECHLTAADAESIAARIEALEAALDHLQAAEVNYRYAHDLQGDGSRMAGRAWDLMRRAGDAARTTLKGTDDGL